MNTLIRIKYESVLSDSRLLDSPSIVEREICLGDFTIHFCIEITHQESGLFDLVPFARRLCDAIVDTTIRQSHDDGRRISCRKGCSNCCSYLVPLSTAEVYHLQRELLLLPEAQRISIFKSCVETAQKILHENARNIHQHPDNLEDISRWYAGLGIRCPFLSNGICTIYEKRPLACREYYVSSQPKYCQYGAAGKPDKVPLPVSVLETLGVLVGQLEKRDVQAVILPLALIETDGFSDRDKHTWEGIEVVNRYLDIIEDTAAKNAQAGCVQPTPPTDCTCS